MSLFVLLLFGCTSEEFIEEDQVAFEGQWWETSCPIPGCPICFMLDDNEAIRVLRLKDEVLWTEYGWWFEEPNKYNLVYAGLEYSVRVEPDADCFQLTLGPIKERACKCYRGEELWNSDEANPL